MTGKTRQIGGILPSAAAGSLSLVGIGTSDEKGISLAGLEELRASDRIFAEGYTNAVPPGTLERLEKLAGKPIALLSREQVEGEKTILQAASSCKTALVVSGDPMIATTHISLVLAAKKSGIRVKIIHAASILSAAIGESGLQAYKFGKTVTLAYWRENYKPMAAYDIISENLARGLHTLLLLDIDEKLGPMAPEAAARLLLDMEKAGGKGILLPETMLVLLQGVGWSQMRKSYLQIRALAASSSCSPGQPAILLIPAALHFLEQEALLSLEK